MNRSRPRRAVVLTTSAAVALVCLTAALVVPGLSSRSSPQNKVELAAAAAPPEVSTPTAAELHAASTVFGVFNRTADATDSLPAGSAYVGGVSRRIGNSSGPLEAWAVSSGDQVCVTVHASSGPASGGPAACNTVAELRKPDQLLVDVSTTPASSSLEVVAGVAPQGVSTVTIDFQDGTSATVPVVDDGFTYTTTDSETISSFSWSASGVANLEKAG